MQLDMGIGAFVVVIVAALVVGFLVQMFLKPKTPPYECLITGVGAGVGGWLASEITWTQWFAGAIFEGLARVVEGPQTTLA